MSEEPFLDPSATQPSLTIERSIAPTPSEVNNNWVHAADFATPAINFSLAAMQGANALTWAYLSSKVESPSVQQFVSTISELGLRVPSQIIQHLPNNINLGEVTAIAAATAASLYFSVGVLTGLEALFNNE